MQSTPQWKSLVSNVGGMALIFSSLEVIFRYFQLTFSFNALSISLLTPRRSPYEMLQI